MKVSVIWVLPSLVASSVLTSPRNNYVRKVAEEVLNTWGSIMATEEELTTIMRKGVIFLNSMFRKLTSNCSYRVLLENKQCQYSKNSSDPL